MKARLLSTILFIFSISITCATNKEGKEPTETEVRATPEWALGINKSVPTSANTDGLATENTATSRDSILNQGRQFFVFDFAELFNPTLKNKFESKLKQYTQLSGLRIRILTLPKSEFDAIDSYKGEYLEKENDVLLYLLPRIDTVEGKLRIQTMNEAREVLSIDTCNAIAREAEKLFINDDQYEAGMLLALDRTIEILDSEIDNTVSGASILLRIALIVLVAYFLYKFSTADFRDGKDKMTRRYRLGRRKQKEKEQKLEK